MKRKLSVVAALAVVGGAAHAQSSVTLYGAIDTGLLYQSTSAASFASNAKNLGHVFALKDAGIYASFWGIRGTEDIGGGYKVNFRLQGVFNSTTGKLGLADTAGATAVFNQQTTIGLSGPFGSIDAGRQYTPMIYAMADTDVRNAQYFGSILSAWLGLSQASGWPGTSTNVPYGALYDSNAIVYQSPKFYGASAALEYAPGGVPGQIQGGTRESAVLKYSNYGLNLAAVYYNGHDTNLPANAPSTGLNNNRFYYLGAKYTFHALSVSASYGIGKNPANTQHGDYEMISGGLGYQFTPYFKVTSGFYYLKDRNVSANHSSEYAVGAEYGVSKRTLLYAQVGYVDNHGTMNQAITYGAPVAPGVSTTAAMLGIRHTF
ncbi:Outer membrane porin protein 32 [Paraburkholderia caffeinitolerans]|uniref:Outer membrane porin protein 32 n=1 Tax=Paraburkholderia caffeinitolerans TaxID=1723730 RepID=A0A6J5GX87_9BURK|nr:MULTISPECIES: porin [Paraburkholderia]CAB3805366.1 Outer membrane porin protein 32 [Paraburkholderia caffeinitolerans]